MITTAPHTVTNSGTCAIVERGLMCGKPIRSDGYCQMHLTRKQRHGNVHVVRNNSGGTPLERFMRTTERTADGMTLDHECHNEASHRGECVGGACSHRACVDLTHLAVKSSGDNAMASANSITAANANKTHCGNGHEFDEANTYFYKNGRRSCRACHRQWERERKLRLRNERY